MTAPTSAQWAVLDRLAKGYRLYSSSPDYYIWFQEEVGKPNPLYPRSSTLFALEDRGWVERHTGLTTPFWRTHWFITEKGRRAIQCRSMRPRTSKS